MDKKVLVVDDKIAENLEDEAKRDKRNIEEVLQTLDYEPKYFKAGEDLQKYLDQGTVNLVNVELVLLDIMFPSRRMQGPSILRMIKEKRQDIPVIMFTVSRKVSDIIEVFNYGADDFIAKPITPDELLLKIETINLELKRVLGFADETSKRVFKHIRNAAETDARVFIHGETGTGKELVARAIHYFSPRARRSFVALYCGGLVETLLESELFGHVRGAFTGATQTREGLFREADKGTLFLDEICDVPLPIQVKLLRALQEGEIRRVGDTKTIKVDVRVMAATNKDIAEELERGRFRPDLFYRLNIYPIYLPSLKERKEDIPILTGYFISEYSKRHKAAIEDIDEGALQILQGYHWPGNVRELEHIVERGAILDRKEKILTKGTVSEIIKEARSFKRSKIPNLQRAAEVIEEEVLQRERPLPEVISELERKIVQSVYEKQDRNQSKTARMLGIAGQRSKIKEKYRLP